MKSGGSWITSTIETFEPSQAIGWRGEATGTHAIHVWRLTADGGATRVETEESMDGWLVSLLRGPVRKILRRGVDSALHSLKTEAERRHLAAQTRRQGTGHATRLTDVCSGGRDR